MVPKMDDIVQFVKPGGHIVLRPDKIPSALHPDGRVHLVLPHGQVHGVPDARLVCEEIRFDILKISVGIRV